MTPAQALAQLTAAADPAKAALAAAYHKAPRHYLGIAVPALTTLATQWRATIDTGGRVTLAAALWQTDIHEARIAAAKLLTQARIPHDNEVWTLIASWVPEFDSWAIADHACNAGARRLTANPARLAEVEAWTTSPNPWTRRAALVITLPWTKQNHPKAQDLQIRDRVLDWAASYTSDKDWFIQKAVAWWLRDLSKHDARRVRQFLAEHGPYMKPWAVKEATKYLAA